MLQGEQDQFLSKDLNNGLERWVPGVTIKFIAQASHWVNQVRDVDGVMRPLSHAIRVF